MTSRGGDQPGAFQFRAVQLREPEHRFGEQLRLRVFEAVELRVRGCIGEPEGGREIHDAADRSHERGRQLHRRVVREAEEHQIESAHRVDVELAEHEVRIPELERGVQLGGSAARHRVAGGDPELEVGVLRDQPEQFGTGEAGCSDDSDAARGPSHLHEHTPCRMNMQLTCRDGGSSDRLER